MGEIRDWRKFHKFRILSEMRGILWEDGDTLDSAAILSGSGEGWKGCCIRDIDVSHGAGAATGRGAERVYLRGMEKEGWKRAGGNAASRSVPTFSSGSVGKWIGVTAQAASSCVVVDGWCTESRINPGWRRLAPSGKEHVTRRAIRGQITKVFH